MSEETFVVELADRRWELPHLPFRLIKSIQPLLFKVYAETSDGKPLDESKIENLSRAVWCGISYVDSAMDYECFIELHFSVSDLFSALPAIAQAAGLRPQNATTEASPLTGKADPEQPVSQI